MSKKSKYLKAQENLKEALSADAALSDSIQRSGVASNSAATHQSASKSEASQAAVALSADTASKESASYREYTSDKQEQSAVQSSGKSPEVDEAANSRPKEEGQSGTSFSAQSESGSITKEDRSSGPRSMQKDEGTSSENENSVKTTSVRSSRGLSGAEEMDSRKGHDEALSGESFSASSSSSISVAGRLDEMAGRSEASDRGTKLDGLTKAYASAPPGLEQSSDTLSAFIKDNNLDKKEAGASVEPVSSSPSLSNREPTNETTSLGDKAMSRADEGDASAKAFSTEDFAKSMVAVTEKSAVAAVEDKSNKQQEKAIEAELGGGD